MRHRYLLPLIVFMLLLGSKVNAQSQKNAGRYTLSWIDQVLIDKENGNDTAHYIALFSTVEDTVTVYKWNIKDGEKPLKIDFWGQRDHTANAVTFLSSEGANVKVSFLKENQIRVETDLYRVNRLYYNFLKQKLLVERSALDLAFFLKEGYGDYAVSLEPLLQKNWRNQQENPQHRIINVQVKNKNEQAEGQFHQWNAVYSYTTSGMLQNIKGEYYNKTLVGNTGADVKYQIEKNLDRSAVRISATQNKKTLMAAVSVNWTQLSTSKEFHYSKYQSRLKQISIDHKPLNFNEIAKLFKIVQFK